jgi:hypothetical protein
MASYIGCRKPVDNRRHCILSSYIFLDDTAVPLRVKFFLKNGLGLLFEIEALLY